jgi:hypothetical protein
LSLTLTQVRDGIHTFLAQAILEKWQQASTQYPKMCQRSQPTRLACFHTSTNSSYPFYTLNRHNISAQHSSSAHGNSVRLQLLQAFAMVVKVWALSRHFYRNMPSFISL